MAWKNFQNGYPLYASELNNYLMKQSVAVFASSAERASILTSPVEGQVTWLQDTNAFQVYNGSAWVDINDNTDAIQKSLLTTQGDLIVASGASTPARLGIGTNGQVLTSNGTTATWTTPSGGGGLTLISSTSMSGNNAITFSSIPGTYKSLKIYLTAFGQTTAQNLFFTVNGLTSDYGYNDNATDGWTQSQATVNPNQASFDISYARGIGTSTTSLFELDIPQYASASWKLINWTGIATDYQNNGEVFFHMGNGYVKTTSAITSITFKTTSTTFNGGTAYLYGVN